MPSNATLRRTVHGFACQFHLVCTVLASLLHDFAHFYNARVFVTITFMHPRRRSSRSGFFTIFDEDVLQLVSRGARMTEPFVANIPRGTPRVQPKGGHRLADTKRMGCSNDGALLSISMPREECKESAEVLE